MLVPPVIFEDVSHDKSNNNSSSLFHAVIVSVFNKRMQTRWSSFDFLSFELQVCIVLVEYNVLVPYYYKCRLDSHDQYD